MVALVVQFGTQKLRFTALRLPFMLATSELVDATVKMAAALHNRLKVLDGYTDRGKDLEGDFYSKRSTFAETRCYRNLKLTANTKNANNVKTRDAVAAAEAAIASVPDQTLVGSQFDPVAHPHLVIEKEVDPGFAERRANLEEHYYKQLMAGKVKRKVRQCDRAEALAMQRT